MKGLGYGAGYRYPHDYEAATVEQQYLPDELAGREYYEPTDRGREREIGERLRAWRASRPAARSPTPLTSTPRQRGSKDSATETP
jgi:putative ATPase